MWVMLGKQLLKGRAKKVATNKLLNRKKKNIKKRTSGKEVSDGIMNREKRKKGGALAIRPTMGLVPVDPVDPISITPGESDVVIIKKQVIQVRDILKDTHSAKQAERKNLRKALQTEKRKEREEKLEKPKVKPKESKGMKMPKPALGIGNFLSWLVFGLVVNKLLDLMPALSKIFGVLGSITKFITGIFAKMIGFVVGFIDLSYAGVEALEKAIGFIGGEGPKKLFERFGKLFTQVLNGALIAALVGARLGVFGGIISKIKGGLFGGGAAAGGAGGAGGVGGAASGGAAAGGMSAGVAAGVVAAAGALAVGLGEGIFSLGKKGYNVEKDWRQKADKKWWTDPRKYWWGISAGLMGFINRIFSGIGGIFDIVGAPFRMIAELIRFPFLSKEGKEKQRTNLEKYDTRIREQFRKFVNMFDFLGVINDDKGSWGSIYGDAAGEKASKEMFGDKTKSQQDTEKTKKTFKVENGIVVGGTGTQEEYETLKKIQRLEDEADFAAEQGDWEKYEQIQKQISILEGEQEEQVVSKKPQGIMRGLTGAADFATLGMFDFDQRNREGAPKDWGIRRMAGGLTDWATLGLTDFDKRGAGNFQVDPVFGGKDKAWGSPDEQAKRREAQSGFGLKRGIGGALDFVTLGMFDFDKQNREGAPKDWGIRRIAGGLTDVATMGLTDFDKRGAGVMQFDPMFGGKDKAWGSPDEQVKRREKQSGFGLKRGIGGALDFVTLGMFDFDKQNRIGAPKDFGIRRMAGGIADWATLGITDFDKRGAGNFQVDPMFGGKDKAWGVADEQAKKGKPKGLWRGITGAADFATLGMFDFDQRNREGAPKDYGIRRIAGGLTDVATMGLTDFDKRGGGNLQFDPLFGGRDKAWGSSNEQTKRREKQSGFGLKRGIGGLIDFATLGMFDFDKQNKKGSPKGWGIKRMVGGLVDVITGGTTDFDKRGSGLLQYSGFTGRRGMQRPRKIDNLRSNNTTVQLVDQEFEELRNKANQLPMETTVNPDGSITSRGSGKFIGGELFTPGQPLSKRQYTAVKFGRIMNPNKKYSDDVLRSYAMYEDNNTQSKVEELDTHSIKGDSLQSSSILSSNTQSKAQGLDTHPSYAQGGLIVIENNTTVIQPIEIG